MKAELRTLISTDTPDLTLEGYTPEEPDNFGVLVRAFVGPHGEQGEEVFDFMVCSPRWLEQKVTQPSKGYVLGRHHLFIRIWDHRLITNVITRLCDNAVGADWNAVARSLARYAIWEFDEDWPHGLDR